MIPLELHGWDRGMADTEIERAGEVVVGALALPGEQGVAHLTEIVNGLVGAVVENDEARVAQAMETDRVRGDLDYVTAQRDHLLRLAEEHGIDVEHSAFHYSPPERRRRNRQARTAREVILDLFALRPASSPETFRPDIVEATETGSITSLPRRDETVPASEPVVVAVVEEEDPYKHPLTHHTRGIDLPPAPGRTTAEIDLSSVVIDLPTGEEFDSLVAGPRPMTAATVIQRQDTAEVPEDEPRARRRPRRGWWRGSRGEV